jgi:hypothetical protein
MRSKDQLRLLTPADAVAINRKMRGHEVRLAYSARIALEISAKRRAVGYWIAGNSRSKRASTSPSQARRSANTSGIHGGACQATLDPVEERRLRRVDTKRHPIHEHRWVCPR